MLKNKTLFDLKKNEEININDENSVEKAILIVRSAIKDYEVSSKEELSDAIKYINMAIFSLKCSINDKTKALKCKNDMNEMIFSLQKRYVVNHLKSLDVQDLIELLDTLTEVCLINISEAKCDKNNTLSKSEISYVDSKGYHIKGDDREVVISRPSYVAARIKGGIIYGASYVGSRVFEGTKKILKRKN